jgi:hypothetical protein
MAVASCSMNIYIKGAVDDEHACFSKALPAGTGPWSARCYHPQGRHAACTAGNKMQGQRSHSMSSSARASESAPHVALTSFQQPPYQNNCNLQLFNTAVVFPMPRHDSLCIAEPCFAQMCAMLHASPSFASVQPSPAESSRDPSPAEPSRVQPAEPSQAQLRPAQFSRAQVNEPGRRS